MPRRDPSALSLALAVAAAVLVGCGDKPAPKSGGAPAAAHEERKTPHGGALIELGEEEAHVELVHDAATGTLTAYVYGKVIGEPASVETPLIMVPGKTEPGEIRPAAVDAKPDGTASQWKVTDPRLAVDPLEGRIRVKVDGKTFQTPLEPSGHGH
jgi:hypothetical protein